MKSAAASELQDRPDAQGMGRILVVDDDRLVLATLSHGLTQAGYDVIDADNGDDAILLAHQQRPELALLDIRMEGLSGFDVAETLRDAYRIPFMFLSAFADQATLDKVRELGALDYLTKPLDVARILPSVAAAMVRVRQAAGVSDGHAGGHADGRNDRDHDGRVLPDAAAGAVGDADKDADADADADAACADPVPLAVGVLMHRHSLTRSAAWQHLQRLATENRMAPARQAERLLVAVEELARSAP
ncbi:MAG: response regulator [Rubrivivax sp.]